MVNDPSLEGYRPGCAPPVHAEVEGVLLGKGEHVVIEWIVVGKGDGGPKRHHQQVGRELLLRGSNLRAYRGRLHPSVRLQPDHRLPHVLGLPIALVEQGKAAVHRSVASHESRVAWRP